MLKLSVIIPTYNRSSYLDMAIKSVLAQRYSNFELVISDNCSKDDTEDVVAKYLVDHRVRYFRNKNNIGMVPNWRRAVYEYAIGEWFLLLSDDDYLIDANYLTNAVKLIKKHESIVMIYAEGYLLDEVSGERRLLVLPFDERVRGVDVFISRGTVKPQDFTLCNIIFNRQRAINLNAFSNPDNISCDSELFLKLALEGDVGVVKGAVSVYRFHSGNLLKTLEKSPKLIAGNIDFLLLPYIYAKSIISDDEVNIFKNNSNISRGIVHLLLMLACHDWRMYVKYKNNVVLKAPELIVDLLGSREFRYKLIYCRYFGWSYPIVSAIRQKFNKMIMNDARDLQG